MIAFEFGKGDYRKGKWCENCKTHTHDIRSCRKKDFAKTVNATDVTKEQSHAFAFKVNMIDSAKSVMQNMDTQNILVDCGATAHIINDKSKVVSFDPKFDPKAHFIELADGTI